MVLKALIVDDEYPSREELRHLLAQFPEVEVVGEAASSTEALKLIQALEYNILFLDIKLSGISGLELTSKLQSLPKKPHVIFVTAYDDYAFDAFGLDAVDYILKPIEKSRLRRAIAKVMALEKISEKSMDDDSPDQSANLTSDFLQDAIPSGSGQKEVMVNRIVAEAKGKIILVDVNDIYFAFTEGASVYIKTFSEKYLIRLTLKELETRLSAINFFRTHRGFIVNIYKVKEIHPFFNGTYTLVLEDKERSEVPVSRNQSKKLRKRLGY